MLFGFQAILAQNIQITGTVSDADGVPLPGVSVVLQGTTTGTATDINGNYSLTAPSNGVLEFSSVGMKAQEIPVEGRTTINVTLEEEALLMDEVVVTALGISREKKSLGYAVQEVDEETLNSSIQDDAISALSGKVAGVQVSASSKMGGSNRILIRGASSITGENQPLIVIDGIPVDNSDWNNNSANGFGGDANGFGGYDLGNMMNDIDPENIESMSVLKGPAAAIYGSRAANGVIVITTKKARAGADAFSVEWSSNVGFEQVYVIPELQRKYGGGAIISDEDGGLDGFEVANINGTDYRIPQYQVDESWGPRYDPNIEVLHWNAFDQESYPDQYLQTRPWVAPENDVIDFYELGTTFANNIAMSRTGENFGVRFAYTNTSTKGTFPGSEIKKNNFTLTGNANLLNKLNVDASLHYVNSASKGRPQVGYGDNSVGQKFFQWSQRQIDFGYLEDYKNNDGSMRTWNRNAWNDPTPKFSDNPYWTAYENYPDDSRNRFYGNVSLSYEIVENLSIKGSVYGDNYTYYNRERTAVGSQAMSKYYEGVRTNSEYNFEAILSYSKQLQDIRLDLFAGGNQRYMHYDFNRGFTSGGLVVPEVYSLLNSTGTIQSNDYTEEKQVNSVFGSAAVDIKGMLFLEGTVRNDWSSTLPDDNNSYFYPSASASFLFSELLPDLSWMSLGKVRFGWAQVGNDTDPYNVVSVYDYNISGPFMGAPRLYVDTELLNASLKSEQTTSTEIGIDVGLLNNRINLAATYFNNVTTDQIMPLEVSKATGYDSKWINAGQMTNKGVEITLGLTPVQTNNFKWQIITNFTKVNNTLNELYPGVETIDLTSDPFRGVFLRASEGDTYGMFWGNDYIYDDDGNIVVDDGGYLMMTPDLRPLGSYLPDYNMGIRNVFRLFNAVDISVLFDIQQGGKFYSVSHMWGMYSGMMKESAGVNDQGNEIRDPVSEGGGYRYDAVTGDVTFEDDGTYTVENTAPNENYISGMAYAAYHYNGFGMPATQNLFDADFIKLRELTIGYTLPAGILGPIKNMRISLYGRNLLTMGLDKPGFDPEITVNGSGNIQGIDGGLYPTSRTFGLNLKLGF